jgi:4-hydroxy-tetrahydrodipicolinate synthase
MKVNWERVFPAVSTQFKDDESLDLVPLETHLEQLIAADVGGLTVVGSVGENYALTPEEKRTVVQVAVKAARGRVPVLAGVAELTTSAACQFARDCERLGADGLMVLPALVYKADAREVAAHYRAVAGASGLPIMIYNNPVSYGVDLTPEGLAALADEPRLVALKDSSNDIRRITDTIALTGDRYILFAGVDDLAIESVVLGARGYVAGMVNAFPREVVRFFDLALAGRYREAMPIYRWLMPLLHLDMYPKFVQYIKLAQQMAGLGSEMVRRPKLTLVGEERVRISALIETVLRTRPPVETAPIGGVSDP